MVQKPTEISRGPMGSLRVGAPGDCLATDCLGPFQVTDRGHRYNFIYRPFYKECRDSISEEHDCRGLSRQTAQ